MTALTGAYVDTTNYAVDNTVDTAWAAATFGTVRWVVIYNHTTGYIRAVYDLAGYPYAVTSGTFTILWNAGGLIQIS